MAFLSHVPALCFLPYHSKFSMLWPGDGKGSHDSPCSPKSVICAKTTGLWRTTGTKSVLDMLLFVQATDAQAKMGQGGTVRPPIFLLLYACKAHLAPIYAPALLGRICSVMALQLSRSVATVHSIHLKAGKPQARL